MGRERGGDGGMSALYRSQPSADELSSFRRCSRSSARCAAALGPVAPVVLDAPRDVPRRSSFPFGKHPPASLPTVAVWSYVEICRLSASSHSCDPPARISYLTNEFLNDGDDCQRLGILGPAARYDRSFHDHVVTWTRTSTEFSHVRTSIVDEISDPGFDRVSRALAAARTSWQCRTLPASLRILRLTDGTLIDTDTRRALSRSILQRRAT